MKSYHFIGKTEKMSLQECLELGKRSSNGDLEARERLIISHIYLVEDIMYSFINKGVDSEDLFQEGCYGLLKAVDLYDYKRGLLFSTYAVHWIRKQMRMALRNQSIDKPVVLKDDEYWLLIKICSYITRQIQKFGYEPNCEEISKEFNIPTEQTTKLLKFSEPFINIDDLSFRGFSSGVTRSAEDEFFNSFIFLDDVPLTDREKTVLCRHLGLSKSKNEESLKEIAASIGLTYETIRLDYRSALQKIKSKITNYCTNI